MAAPIDFVPVKNATGEIVPSGGLLRVAGQDDETGALLVDKPNLDGSGAVAVNDTVMIPAGGFGQAHFDTRAIAAYDRTDGLPEPGESWGARAGSWLLRKGEAGFVITAGAGLGLANVVRLGGAAPDGVTGLATCRDKLAGLDPATDRITFQVLDGTNRCAEIAAKKLVGWAPDPDVEEWLSVGTFPTKLGDTSLEFQFDEDTGDPVLLLTATTGEGSGATTVIQPMTFVGCKSGCPEFAARPLLWCDSAPVTDCDDLPDGAPRRYRLTATGGTGDYADLNGEWTALWDAGCSWAVVENDDGVTGTVQWLPESGPTPRRQLVNLSYPDGTTAVLLSADEDSTSGCVTKTGELDVDLPGGSGGSGVTGTPPTLTVTPVGPCAVERCADNTFRVRVCCKAHAKYDGCDALPDYSGAWCITGTSGFTGEAGGGELSGNYGPSFQDGPGLFRCDTGEATEGADDVPDDFHDDRCGFDLYLPRADPVLIAALTAAGAMGENLIRVIVYYDPDADAGAGAWVLARFTYCGTFGNDCCFTIIATAANDPDPTDDPFEIVFKIETGIGTGVFHELRITPGPCEVPAEPVCDASACPDGGPQQFTQTLAGGTGDYAQLNGPWAYTHVSGNTWVGVLGSCTATAVVTGTSPTADIVTTFDAPGIPGLLGLRQVVAASFDCCATTPMTNNLAGGSGDPPTPSDLTPVGDCECDE